MDRAKYEERIISVMKHLYDSRVDIGGGQLRYSVQNSGSRTLSLFYRLSGGLIGDFTPINGIVIAEGFPRPTHDQIFVNPSIRIRLQERKLMALERRCGII
ncbi:MAG: hypothetical protein HYS62_02330 [Candidatus Aenigmarchaeota archaeon]|nr:hypothetical protein [Candidatus Aenigmarchaeota archaeon]